METTPDEADELRPGYNLKELKGAVRGKYVERYKERTRIVRLAADVADSFPDEESVNEALRQYLKEHNKPLLADA